MTTFNFPKMDNTSGLLFSQVKPQRFPANEPRHTVVIDANDTSDIVIDADMTCEEQLYYRFVEPLFGERTIKYWFSGFAILVFALGIVDGINWYLLDGLLGSFGA